MPFFFFPCGKEAVQFHPVLRGKILYNCVMGDVSNHLKEFNIEICTRMKALNPGNKKSMVKKDNYLFIVSDLFLTLTGFSFFSKMENHLYNSGLYFLRTNIKRDSFLLLFTV